MYYLHDLSSLKVDRWGEGLQGLDRVLFASYLHRLLGHRDHHVFFRVLSLTWLPLWLLWECWLWCLQGFGGVWFHHAGPVHCQGYCERWPPTFYRCQSSELAEVRGGGTSTGPYPTHFLSSPFCCFLLLDSDVGMCRICHEGAGGETLLSPCDCTGTLGKVHKSCLEKWLSSSNTSYCELCHTEFTIERRPQPLTQVSKALTV